jgi:hypothetical protein
LAADRADGPAQPPRRLPFRQAFHIAKHDDCAKRLWEPIDLLVEHLGKFVPLGPGCEVLGQLGRPPFMLAPPTRGHSRPGRDTAGDAVQPTGQGGSASDRSGPARQDQERRLKCILGVVIFTEDRAADAEHHRTMSLKQSLERRSACLAVSGHEPLEQLLVGQIADHSLIEEGASVSPNSAMQNFRHAQASDRSQISSM